MLFSAESLSLVGHVRCLEVILSMLVPLEQLPMSHCFKHLPSHFSIISGNISPCFIVTRFLLESDWNLSCCHLNPLVHIVLHSREAKNSCLAPPLFLTCSCWGITSVHPTRESPSNFFVTRSHCKLLSKCCLAASCSRHLPPT